MDRGNVQKKVDTRPQTWYIIDSSREENKKMEIMIVAIGFVVTFSVIFVTAWDGFFLSDDVKRIYHHVLHKIYWKSLPSVSEKEYEKMWEEYNKERV